MTTEQLSKAIRTAPFRPFRLKLADSRTLEVPHPDWISYVVPARTASVWVSDDGAHEIVDLLLVVGLEFDAPRPALAEGR